MIPTVTKYEFPTPLQLEDICKNEKPFFSREKMFLVNRVILIFKVGSPSADTATRSKSDICPKIQKYSFSNTFWS